MIKARKKRPKRPPLRRGDAADFGDDAVEITGSSTAGGGGGGGGDEVAAANGAFAIFRPPSLADGRGVVVVAVAVLVEAVDEEGSRDAAGTAPTSLGVGGTFGTSSGSTVLLDVGAATDGFPGGSGIRPATLLLCDPGTSISSGFLLPE